MEKRVYDYDFPEGDIESHIYKEEKKINKLFRKQETIKRTSGKTPEKKKKKSYVEKIKNKSGPIGPRKFLTEIDGIEEHYQLMKQKVDTDIVKKWDIEDIFNTMKFQQLI